MFDDSPFDDPPPKPPCKHKYKYSIYYEKLKKSYVAKRQCEKCGTVERQTTGRKNIEDEDMSEEQIKKFFRKS